MNLELLNNYYGSLSPKQRLEQLYQEYPHGKILVTSSFGATSVILLHMISEVSPGQKIHFVDTGYHFPQTLAYREKLSERLNLNIVDLRATSNRHNFTAQNFTYEQNQNLCCFINKVDPLKRIVKHYHIWISGLLRFQNENRSKLQLFKETGGVVKFHPLLDMTQEETALYLQRHDLPVNQLVNQGFDSIGCTHCTSKGTGSWMNIAKTECGLHI